MDIYEKIFSFISKRINNISQAEGKDVILFIGPNEVGKSTILNGLLGVQLREKRLLIEPIHPEQLIVPINNSNCQLSIYKFPCLYNRKDSNLYYLEIPGVCTDINDKITNTVSMFLIQMIINFAKTIRLVFLNKYEIFDFGARFFYFAKKELSRFVITDNIPLYFLFNKLVLNQNLLGDNFLCWPNEKQNLKIKEIIKEKFNYSFKISNSNIEKKIKRIIQRSKDDGLIKNENILMESETIQKILEKNPEYQDIKKQNSLIHMFKNNFSKGYYGYIDPTSQDSIERVMNDILLLPPIDKSCFFLNKENSDIQHFEEFLFTKINNVIDFMKQIQFAKLYSEIEIDQLINKITQNISIKKKTITQIENKSNSKELLDLLLEEFNQEEQLMKKELLTSISKLEEKQSNLEQKFYIYTYQTQYEIWNDSFSESIGVLNFKEINSNGLTKNNPNTNKSFLQHIALVNFYNGKADLTSYNDNEQKLYFAFPKKIYQQFLSNFNWFIIYTKEQIINCNVYLRLLNNNLGEKIEKKLSLLVYFLTQHLLQIKIIKERVHSINSIIKEKYQNNIIKNDEFILYYELIKKAYRNYTENPIMSEFIQIYDDIKSSDDFEKKIEIQNILFISEGNIVFHLNQEE